MEEVEFVDFEMFEGLDDLFDINEEDKNWFGLLVEEEEIFFIKKLFESKNMCKNINWSLSIFLEWRKY